MTWTTRIVALAGMAAATSAQAQPAQPDPLSSLQGAFGTIVGNAFTTPDRIAAAVTPNAAATLAPPLGGALRTSLQIPGAAFVALMSPLASLDAVGATPPPTAAPVPPRVRQAKSRHEHKRT